jgi:hypothetical protein
MFENRRRIAQAETAQGLTKARCALVFRRTRLVNLLASHRTTQSVEAFLKRSAAWKIHVDHRMKPVENVERCPARWH